MVHGYCEDTAGGWDQGDFAQVCVEGGEEFLGELVFCSVFSFISRKRQCEEPYIGGP